MRRKAALVELRRITAKLAATDTDLTVGAAADLNRVIQLLDNEGGAMSSKQVYEQTARIVREHVPLSARTKVADAFAKDYRAGNPNFDREKFLAACGAIPDRERMP